MTRQDYKEFFSQRVNPTKLVDEILKPILGDYTEDKSTNNYATFDDYKDTAQKAHVDRIKKTGEFKTDDNDPVVVFDIVLNDACNVSVARKNIQGIARKLIESFSGAFLIFHYDQDSTRIDKDTWRLSWVKKERTQTHSTPAKRYTYLCGPSYSCRTIAERFEKLQNEPRMTLDTITKAFDVEALSDEFFKEYKVMYDDIVQWITGQRIIKKDGKWKEEGTLRSGLGDEVYVKFYNAFGKDDKIATKAVRDYVKKLLGRLVFIQFLQKKEWLKIDGTISTNFLLDLFQVISDNSRDNFIETALERVVYLLLNNENREKDSEKIDNHVLDVPFLNGGLFERDQYDNLEIKLPKEFFHNETYKEEKRVFSETSLRVNDNFFSQCGILDLFNQYNFTIDENDPDDAEVGVDPEMLGKIFENLLEDNKDKGAFYTPKEIVQYMCNESLIAYLQTKVPNHDDEIRQFVLDAEQKDVPEKDKVLNAIQEVKICDPAIGSGAFPMGLLNLLVALREKLEPSTQRVELKKSIIQNNIYGVDIEKGAIDIARLRFWLSIMVDEEKPTPLPNFEYKFMQGNSLLTTFDLQYVDIKQAKENRQVTAEINKKKQELYKIKNEYYGLNGEDKYKKEVDIKLLIVEILKLRLGFEKVSVEQQDTTRQMELFAAPDMPQNSRSKKKIQEVKAAQERVQRLIEKLLEIEKQLKDETKTWEERAKTDILFFDWEICFAEIFPQDKPENERGFDIVIGNPPYISAVNMARTESEKALYKKIYTLAKGAYDIYVLFLLLGARKSKNVYTWIIPNKFLVADYANKIKKHLIDNGLSFSIDVSTFKVFKSADVYPIIISGSKLSLSTFKEYDLVQYTDLKENKLHDRNTTKAQQTIADYGLGVCSGATGFEAQKIKKFVKDSPQNNSIPFTVSGNIDRYSYNCTNVRYMKELYSNAHIILDSSIADSKIMMWKRPKIIIAGMTKVIEATFVEKPLAIGVGTYAINDFKGYDPLYILGLINSKYTSYFLRNNFKDKHLAGGYLAINKKNIEQLPFNETRQEIKNNIIALVDKILKAKNADPQTDTTALEREIDILVYLLYSLTWEEVQIVENSFMPSKETDETEGKKGKGKKKAQSSPMPKLNLNEPTYTKWLERYQKDGTLPSEEEMEEAMNKPSNQEPSVVPVTSGPSIVKVTYQSPYESFGPNYGLEIEYNYDTDNLQYSICGRGDSTKTLTPAQITSLKTYLKDRRNIEEFFSKAKSTAPNTNFTHFRSHDMSMEYGDRSKSVENGELMPWAEPFAKLC